MRAFCGIHRGVGSGGQPGGVGDERFGTVRYASYSSVPRDSVGRSVITGPAFTGWAKCCPESSAAVDDVSTFTTTVEFLSTAEVEKTAVTALPVYLFIVIPQGP